MMRQYRDLNDFLRKNRTTDKSKTTHTRIGNGGNVLPGKFEILPEEYDVFYKLYHKHVFVENNKEYLTEKQLKSDNAMLLVDLDFRYEDTIKERKHTEEHIYDLVQLYADVINNNCENVLGKYDVYVMEKPNVNTKKKGMTKDGIHLVFNVGMPHQQQLIIREKVKELIPDVLDDLDLTNSYDDVLDDGISKGTTNWQMYGSRKPDNEAYQITKKYLMEFTEEAFDIEEQEVEEISADLLQFISPKYTNTIPFQVNKELLEEWNKKNTRKNKPQNKIVKTDENPTHFNPKWANIKNEDELNKAYEEIRNTETDKWLECLSMLPTKFADDFNLWLRVGWALKGQNESYFLLWIIFSQSSQKFDFNDVAGYFEKWTKEFFSADEARQEYENGALTCASIAVWLKQEDPEKYQKWSKKYRIKKSSILTTISHASVADKFIEMYGHEFLYCNKKIYHWNGDVWDDEGAEARISAYIKYKLYNKMHEDVMANAEAYGESLSKILGTLISLTNRTFREKTCKDVKDSLILSRDKEIKFNFEETQKHNIHFKNGVLMLDKIDDINDIFNTAFRKRVKTDYMTSYNDYDFVAPDESIIDEIKKLYTQIQPDKETHDYFMTFLAYCLTGDTHAQKCEFDIGYTASNGKSTHLDIHDKAMPFYSLKFAKQTFNEGFTKAHKQLIKLFEKPVRLAYMEELNTATMDAELFKDFVDGKKLNVEILYGTSLIQQHQAKLKACGNHDLHIKSDRGVLRRGLKVEFISEFVDGIKRKVNEKKLRFKADEKLCDKFNTDEYKCGYIYTLLPFYKSYAKNGLLAPLKISNAFEDMVNEFDELKIWLDENIKDCDDDEDVKPEEQVSKQELLSRVECAGFKNGWKSILPKVKMMGYKYDRFLSCGFDDNDKRIRGGLTGCKWVNNDQ